MQDTLFPLDDRRQVGYSPRHYQRECVDKVAEALRENPSCLAVLATGTGKTEITAALIPRMRATEGCVVVTPLRELVTQTAARLRSRGIDCSIEMASMRSTSPVTVACYASMLSRRRYENFIESTKLLVVDESHLNYTKAAIQMIGYFREAGAKIVGMTASPDRNSGDPLTKWYGPLAYYYPYRSALDDGWLVPTRLWMTVIEDFDLTGFRSAYGDFDAEKLAKIMARERVVHAVASMVEQHYEGQPSVVFCQSIQQSELLREVLYRRGIHCAIVHSKMDPMERQQHLNDFEQGNCDVILNVGVLTLGWDFPPVKKLFLARPTKSKARYIQMFGRGCRPLPGVVDGWSTAEQRRQAIACSDKPYCEIFDITDTSRHNDLCCGLDMYAPELDPRLMQRVRRAAEKAADEGVEPDAIIESERAAMAAEEAAIEALEVEKRKHLRADARFGVYERDVFAGSEQPESNQPKRRGWRMLFGKHEGWPLGDVPTDYLRWVIAKSSCRNKAFMDAVRTEVYRRDRTKKK